MMYTRTGLSRARLLCRIFKMVVDTRLYLYENMQVKCVKDEVRERCSDRASETLLLACPRHASVETTMLKTVLTAPTGLYALEQFACIIWSCNAEPLIPM
jgi:hypothetical protein